MTGFQEIHNSYSLFHKELLSKGRLPMKDTGIGYWGVTPHKEAFELFKSLQLNNSHSFIDLGSGDGRIVLIASLFCKKAVGIEYDSWLFKVSKNIHTKLSSSVESLKRAELMQGNFMFHDISEYDFVFISPDKPFHRDNLEKKFQKELKGKLIVHGYEFHPYSLNKIAEKTINGELFAIYEKP